MDANTVALIVGIISPLATLAAGFGGVRWGASLSEKSLREQHAEELKERRTEREVERSERKQENAERRQNVRTLIRLENEHNLAALNEFWEKAVSVIPDGPHLGYSTEEVTFLQRQRLASVLLAPWGHLMWQSQAEQLSALPDNEMLACYRLHVDLEQFSSQRAEVQAEFASTEGMKVWEGYTTWRTMIDSEFAQGRVSGERIPSDVAEGYMALIQRTQPMWDECERIYKLHHANNPIAQDEAKGR